MDWELYLGLLLAQSKKNTFKGVLIGFPTGLIYTLIVTYWNSKREKGDGFTDRIEILPLVFIGNPLLTSFITYLILSNSV